MTEARTYTRTFRYRHRDVPFDFWLIAKDHASPDVVIFLGAGQVGRISRWVAQTAGPGVIVVDGLPHWEAHPSGADTEEFSIAYVAGAFEAILKTFDLETLNVISESQAAPAAVILARNVPSKISNLALIRPLGFTTQTFGDSVESRLREFRRRALRTCLQLFYHPRNVVIGIIMLRAILREPSWTSFSKKYAAGISYDLLEDCREAIKLQQSKGCSFTLLLGERDKMFPPKEIISALQGAVIEGISIEVLPNLGHSSLAARSSHKILGRAINRVREV